MKISSRVYELQGPYIKHNYTYINISDIHSNYKAMAVIKEVIDYINPDFIVMTGDILDTVDNKNNPKLFEIINSISEKYPIFISYGNHDCVSSHHRHEMTGDYSALNILDKNKANILASRGFYNLSDDIRLISFNTKSKDWYYEEREEKSVFLDEFNRDYAPSNDRFNILLTHSPNPFF